jgi:hypothetical protein
VKQEALVAVEIEAGGIRAEVEGEARGGGVDGSEHSVVASSLDLLDGRRGMGF